MGFQKIGFLTKGSGGNPSGIGDYVRRLDSAGVPAVVFCNDGTVGISDVFAQWDAGSTVPHVTQYRSVANVSPVPNYDAAPKIAAQQTFADVEPTIPIEVKQRRDRVVVAIGNELDHERSEWIAQWMIESALIWNAANYRIATPNWASGEPEPADWRTPSMLEFLRLVAESDGNVVVGLHEYSYRSEPWVDTDGIERGPIWYGYPYHCGRFLDLFAAADENGIARPPVMIKEWGWRDTGIPGHDRAMADIREIADLYAEHDEILGCSIWYLGDWQGSGIENQVQRLIAPVTDFSIAYEPPPPVEPPPIEPPVETFERWVWRRSIEQQTVSFNPDALLQKLLNAERLSIVESEFWDMYDGQTYAIQAGESIPGTDDRAVAVVPVPPDGQPWPEPFLVYEPDDDPLAGFRVAAPFRVPFAKTSSFNDSRPYGNGLHEGIDFDVLENVADSDEPVLAGVAGHVVQSDPVLSGYGIHRVVETVHDGDTVRVWYCHLDRAFVDVGDRVQIGDPIGEIGDTSGTRPIGEHVHINIQIPGRGLDGYVVPDVVDPEPYVDREPQIPPTVGFDLRPYFMTPTTAEYWNAAIGRFTGHIVILKNTWGQGDERQQLQGNGVDWLVTKNRLAEKRTVSAAGIEFNWDTSPGDGRAYRVSGGLWLPARMNIGETFARHEITTWYDRATCQRLPQFDTDWTTGIRLIDHMNEFRTGTFDDQTLLGSITVRDVVRLQWIVGGAVEENYWYAAGLGLVQWAARDGRKSWAHEFVNRNDQHANDPFPFNC